MSSSTSGINIFEPINLTEGRQPTLETIEPTDEHIRLLIDAIRSNFSEGARDELDRLAQIGLIIEVTTALNSYLWDGYLQFQEFPERTPVIHLGLYSSKDHHRNFLLTSEKPWVLAGEERAFSFNFLINEELFNFFRLLTPIENHPIIIENSERNLRQQSRNVPLGNSIAPISPEEIIEINLEIEISISHPLSGNRYTATRSYIYQQ